MAHRVGAAVTLRGHREFVVPDRQRHFVAVNCRTAKGSFDRLVGSDKVVIHRA